MDWAELKDRNQLDPKTPAEFAEAMRRMVVFLTKEWDNLEDGDGETASPDDDAQTKTDMFHIMAGCADCACQCIKDFRKFQQK